MKDLFNKGMRLFLSARYRRINEFLEAPHETQKRVFHELLRQGSHTEYGRKYGFSHINDPKSYAKKVPVQGYEDIKPYIDRMMMGEADILWPGFVRWFSKSSGTTTGKSKFIPVPKENLYGSHIRGSWDTITIMYQNFPESRLFADKSLVMGGSLDTFEGNPDTKIGDVSAIMLYHMPIFARPFYTPDLETALLPNWDEKIERMARICTEESVTMFGGVPTWTIVLFRRILEMTGKDNMLEVWPDLRAYIHGGVGFDPYREQFKEFVPSDEFIYQEVYNASEGYFAIQDHFNEKGMLLMLDNSIYYEFIPREEWGKEFPETVTLKEVELGETYALVISTNAGLWRYTPGDTVTFTSLDPYRIMISGRTKQFINAFGEEVMVGNTDKAIARTCEEFDAIVSEYTVAPVYIEDGQKGGHEWLIEFAREPGDLDAFSRKLDLNLQAINSDYEAKRYKDMALSNLRIKTLPENTFIEWMRRRGKIGGQNKVPRLCNSREYVDQILSFIEEKSRV